MLASGKLVQFTPRMLPDILSHIHMVHINEGIGFVNHLNQVQCPWSYISILPGWQTISSLLLHTSSLL